MKYKGLYIDETDISGVLREKETGDVLCKGICFGVFADHEYQIKIDDFIGAYGFEIEENDESEEKFLKWYVDGNYEEYKEKQFKALLEADYKAFVYDVKHFEEDFDIIDNAEQIADMKRAYENLCSLKDIPLETMEYIVTLRRPLETICDCFIPDKNQFVKEFVQCVKDVASEKKCNYGLLEEYEQLDEKDIAVKEAENDQEMMI